MKERLLEKSFRKESLPAFHPFQCPPDFKLAEYHRKATKVRKLPQSLSQDLIICPCCDNVINKTQFSMLCAEEEFASIGIGYTLFFTLYKYFAIILLFIFVISGGAFFFIISIECQTSCVKFFGIPIMSENMAFSEQKGKAEVIHIVTAVFLLGLIIAIKHYLNKDIEKVQKKVLCPSQYTIMIQNLPITKLDFYDFKKWIHEKLKCIPISINVAYNTHDFFKAKQIIQDLEIQKNKLIIKRRKMIRSIPISSTNNSLDLTNTEVDNEIKEIQKKIQQQKKIVSCYFSDQNQQKQIGTVFVTFNSAQQVERILASHEKTLFNFLIDKIAGLFKARELQYKGNQLVFCRAPGPREVLWENLQFSYLRNIFFEVCYVIGMVMFMILTFRIQYWFVSRMYKLRHQGQETGNKEIIFQAVMMSGLIMVLNILLRGIIQLLTKLRKFYSYTKEETSFCTYYSLIFIVNSCFTIYIVHGKTLESSNQLLLIDIHTIMLTNAFSEPLFKIFDPIMWIKMLQKFRIQKTSLENIPYTQSYIHRLWQGHQISNADNYQYIIRVLFITIWFANIAPLGVLFSLLGMLCDYWIIKFLFIKVYKQPKSLSKEITKCLDTLQLIPLVYIGGIMPFLYKITLDLHISTLFNIIFHYSITIIMIFISILAYLYKFRPKVKYITQKKYSDIDLAFGFNYETQNPATKLMGEKKFLQQILKKQKTVDTQHLIRNILDDTQSGRFQANTNYVNKLKLTLTRKIRSTIDQDRSFEIEMKDLHEQENEDIRESIPALLKRKIQKF